MRRRSHAPPNLQRAHRHARQATEQRDRELHRQAKKVGRPKIGQGARVFSLSVERGLLQRADALAKRRKISRAELVAEALRVVLGKAG